MTIRKKMLLLLLSALLGIVVLAGLAQRNITSVYEAANYSTTNTVPSIVQLDYAIQAYSRTQEMVYQHVINTDDATMASLDKAIIDERTKINEALKKYEAEDITDEKDRSMLADDRAVLAAYDVAREKLLALSRANKIDEARALTLVLKTDFEKTYAVFEAHRQYNVELGAKAAGDAASTKRSAARMSIALVLVTLAMVGTIGLVITNKLLRQLGGEPEYAMEISQRIAQGDLTANIMLKQNDTASLMAAMKNMNDSLVKIVGEVRSGTDTIATASGQIASGNLDLSSRTEQQASSLEETASSMEQLTSTVKQNADNARQANQLAISASEVAVKGGAVVSQVVGTMGAINESARKIVDIIGVIDGIAFQTNILALNAAVEAARAGEQGRGFAVVATEVRNLAQRSAGAAKEIKSLIGDSVEKVEAGARLVDQAGVTMQAIVESIKSVTDIMAEITAASQEQTAGIEQINQSITQMDDVTQQNASLVEEAAAASQSLQDQAGSLAQVVGVFKINAVNGAAGTPTKLPRRPASIAAMSVTSAVGGAGRVGRNTKALKQLAQFPASAGSDWEEF
ncbi:methyl-accepting chemotaxis protein [Duganella sp. BJB488]|uniref:methyl-accepting chemotaxis protein n=1 Tax=unclassified Duganella TaxID=2636909 RepID=UPI000E342A85|nr:MULTISPECIES: methyl-accepting chemotaxis protein [unclassified Duganella]RFP13278.1 methyl-accepting chemotaxis protein [Duganella sp. BJB489]RFP17146.1 methyl-accepting chemotaxis protein [Duganella sp. BJB488]RFP31635.1 methyl-accepting chemotaxis protein [Duganella sp. BJB480]